MTVTEIRKTKSDIDQGLKLNRSRKNLRRDVGKAIADYTMIEEVTRLWSACRAEKIPM